jgi:hypothetical protein
MNIRIPPIPIPYWPIIIPEPLAVIIMMGVAGVYIGLKRGVITVNNGIK